ncbi:MAG: DEAD/DEAH box helicase [Lachnospiraceae bacterium]
MIEIQLYPWQEECLSAWTSHDCRGIVNVITGAGKTVLAIAAVNHLRRSSPKPLRVKIVVPTTSLLSQWRDSLLEYSDSPAISREEIGYYHGTRKDPVSRPYMIYMIHSARYCLARHILADLKNGYSVLLIADECHHYTSEENSKIFEFLPFVDKVPGHYYSLGLSATPRTQGYQSVLAPALGNEIYRYTFSDAAKRNAITPFALFQIALSFDPEERASYDDISDSITTVLMRLNKKCPSLKNLRNGQFFAALSTLTHSPEPVIANLARTALYLTYKRRSLICNAKDRLPCACKLIDILGPKTKIIIFGERTQQADQLYRYLGRLYPNQVGCCHSKIGNQARKNALERFHNGEIRILISCRALDEGFDVPAATVGIVLSSTSGERQRIQRLGRVIRNHKGKEIAGLYYLYLEKTVESPSFFTVHPKEVLFHNVFYSREEGCFSFPEYEDAATQLLNHLQKTISDKAALTEARKCLLQGMMRTDRLLGKVLGDDIWEQKIQAAKTIREKNYWICMRMMGNIF